MSPIQNINPSMVRVDFSRADKYVYPEAPKMTFFQKLGRGLGHFMNFAGPVGAAVTAIALPGIGLPIAAGLYGMTRLSQDQMAKSDMKRQIDVANQPQPTNIQMPGFFEQGPLQAGNAATNFMAPSSMDPSISRVIIERNSAAQAELGKFNPSFICLDFMGWQVRSVESLYFRGFALSAMLESFTIEVQRFGGGIHGNKRFRRQ